jgi:hypothetical protein
MKMRIKFTNKQLVSDKIRLICRPVILGLLILLVSSKAWSQTVLNIVVSPSSSAVQVNQTFTVNVTADFFAAGSLNAITTYLNFNTLDLEVASTPTVPAATATLLPNVSVDFTTVATMNSSGQINYGRFINSPTGHPNADFNLYTVTFRAKRVPPGGTTSITFSTTAPRRTVAAEGLTTVSNLITGGTATVTTCTPPTAIIANTLTCNGQAFSLNLTGATGVSPYDLVINGQTYNDVAVGQTITPFTPPVNNIFTNPSPVSNDEVDAPVTLGVKFQSNVTGFVKGVRFFGHGTPSGTYRGQLWSNAGALLASATFSGVSGNNWNQVLFSSPILIAANTTYIVSYHTTSGSYTATAGGLNGSVTNASLTALSGGTSGGNGVFSYGGAPTFPSNSFGNANYWADVVFTPAAYTFNLTSITDGSGCTVTGAPISTLGVLSADCALLPVTLLNLSATPQNGDVVLRWTTSSEIDNKGFEIQRSTTGGGAWEGIAYINGAGNSSSLLNYSYTDKKLFPTRYNYRLKQEDIDGHYKYSMIVSVTLEGDAQFKLGQNYPNPFKGETAIQFVLPVREKVTLTIFDMNGRVAKVLVNNVSKDAGTHAVNFFTSSLPPGIYYYRLQAGSFSETKKMIVQ